MIRRENFLKIEECLLYLLGVLLFTTFGYLKILMYPIVGIMILRRVLYGEKLECGSEKLKKILICFIIIGIVWNFLANGNYRDSRAFLQGNKYIVLIFFLYPLLTKTKETFSKFLIAIGVSISVVSLLGIKETYVVNSLIHRIGVFNGIINTAITGFVGTVSGISFLIISKNKKVKIFGGIIFILSYIALMLTQTRSAFLAMVCIFLFMSIIILIKTPKKKVGIMIVAIFIILSFQLTPKNTVERLSTTFNREKTIDNASNTIRVEMVENAIFRIRKKPILGEGSKGKRSINFEKYVKNMPENTSYQIEMKKILSEKFDESHNTYLNIIAQNGIFSLYYFAIILYILILFLKNLKIKNEDFLYSANLAIGGAYSGFFIIGFFWPLLAETWSSFLFYAMAGMLISINKLYQDEKICF